MPRLRLNKLIAFVVLVGFAAWMGTGKFSSVGSAATEDAAKPAQTEEPKALVRTVAVVAPPHVQHARAIRISGQTEAEKRATLATRVMGVIKELPVRQGEHVNRGDLIMRLDAEDKKAAVDMAEILITQRQAEADAAERLVKGGNAPKLQADQARSALAAAKAQLETAQAELARNEIYAPFNGVIDRVPVERGSTIMAGGEVAILINLDPLLAHRRGQRARPALPRSSAPRRMSGWSTAPPSRARCATSAATPRRRPAPSGSRWRSPTRTRSCRPA